MKYAFYPGCVARGGAPELYDSALAVMERLGIEHVEVRSVEDASEVALEGELDGDLGGSLHAIDAALVEIPLLDDFLGVEQIDRDLDEDGARDTARGDLEGVIDGGRDG